MDKISSASMSILNEPPLEVSVENLSGEKLFRLSLLLPDVDDVD